jgi:hypothetical protein
MIYAMDYWARQVKNEQEIPESFVAFFDSFHLQSEQFPYTVFAPPEKGYRSKSTPKLLVLLQDRLYLAEKIKKQIQTTCFLFQDINYIENGTILLHSWLEINGIANGHLTTVRVEYNSVVEYLFLPFIQRIRTAVHHLDFSDLAQEQLKKEQSRFDSLVKTDFKYMNFGKRSLLPGERIRQYILQPDIQVKFFKYFQHTISYTHLTILTDQELILVKDDDSFIRKQQIRHGGIWRYIPLSKIIKMMAGDVLEHDLVKLTLRLSDGVNFSSLFSPVQRSELELLLYTANRLYSTQEECV